MTDLKGFFAPRRVAVLGASESSGWTQMLLDGASLSAAAPEIVMVNPTRSTVHGRPCLPSLAGADGVDGVDGIDLAFVQVGPGRVVAAVEDALAAGVRDFVVLSAGLAEAGPEGRAAERRLTALVAEHGARLLGPNVSGFVSPADDVTLFGLPRPEHLLAGGVGLVMQSGGLATHALGLCAQWGIGISRMVTTGNEACVTASHVIGDLAEDPSTSVIAVFLESVRDPEVFAEAVGRALRAGKAVVALPAGRSELGRSSALAHTGALVGDHAATVAGLEGLGVVCVESFEDLVATAGLLAAFPAGLSGDRLGVVAASGGACELIADHAHDLGLLLPELPAEVARTLGERLPADGVAKNPLDVTGFVVKDGDLVFAAADAFLGAAPATYDALLFQSVTFPRDDRADAADVVARFRALGELQRGPVPVLLQTAATYALTPGQLRLVAEAGVFVLPGIQLGLRAVAAAHRSWLLRARLARLAGAARPGDGLREATDLATAVVAAGLPVPPRELVAAPAEVGAALDRIGAPVVVKIVSADIAHKSDVGGVVLDVVTADQAVAVAERMLADVTLACPTARIDGVEVVAQRSAGVEILAAVVVDATWGPVLTVGAGGVHSEVLADVTSRALPVDARDVEEMLAGLRLAPLFDGYRGAPAVDRPALVDAVLAVARLWHELGATAAAVEVNPIAATAQGAEALDLLVEWA